MEAQTVLFELSKNFNVNNLSNQLTAILVSKDPIGYMQENINWEIDLDGEAESPDDLQSLTAILNVGLAISENHESWNPIKRFLEWLQRNQFSGKIKKAICTVANEVQNLIDEEAELKKILGVAVAAVVAAIGMGSINPVILTLIVGFLAAAILKGVAVFCEI